ncbi:hypothetical protein F4808DRAFT_353500 [Astrocystis sublimbata]|nr:hypothetical protein F4808DRAFT_353500 [Astrocystis sublimbata]
MTDFNDVPFITINSRQPLEDSGFSSGDSAYGSSLESPKPPSATHDISRVNYHVKRLPDFAKALEDSAARAFPNRGSSQRYKNVHALLLHWDSDDLFVLPELEDLEKCFRQDYNFETERFTIPSSNAHLELMLKIGSLIKDHESTDTLLIVVYAGHGRIDVARQSTWCASRNVESPWLQWSAIQTLLERSLSDALILLDCCAGAASAAFPTGNSITETISASSWDAIAPSPGRYSFTSTLLEVLQEWKWRTFSVAMLHAEILARLKHPRPENGLEVRTTPVHFMMTANHRAPSIELCMMPSHISPSLPPSTFTSQRNSHVESRSSSEDIVGSVPNENVPHVMISLALEDDQNLNVDDWERWLSAFPALAKYVQVQGIFKSHSTLLLLSLPVMVWDMLPNHPACTFIAFIRSNNIIAEKLRRGQSNVGSIDAPLSNELEIEQGSTCSGSTEVATYRPDTLGPMDWSMIDPFHERKVEPQVRWPRVQADITPAMQHHRKSHTPNPLPGSKGERLSALSSPSQKGSSVSTSRQDDQIQTAEPVFEMKDEKRSNQLILPAQAENRLEEYFIDNKSNPTFDVQEVLASSLGLDTADIDRWFRLRREQQEVSNKFQSLRMGGQSHPSRGSVRMILPGHLNKLLDSVPASQILVIDLRASQDYQRSHIHGAINFRAPASFVSRASKEMVEEALVDSASRDSFRKWYTSKCVVFYDKILEYPWEAPVAEAFFQKFRSNHWPGQCFVLKGHFREFSHSFDRYIVGSKTTEDAARYLASLQKISEKNKDENPHYEDWLKLLDDEDRGHVVELPPAAKSERLQAAYRHQRALGDEFRQAFPSLYQQAQNGQPDDNWSVKAPMVAHLERGMAKMQQEAASIERTHDTNIANTYGRGGDNSSVNKMREVDNPWESSASGPPQYTRYPVDTNDTRTKGYMRKEADESYDNDYAQQHTGPALPRSHSSATLRGTSPDELPVPAPDLTPTTSSTGSAPQERRSRSSSGNLFVRMIRSGKPDAPPSR